MKILYINNFAGVDYLNDVIFHGARTVYGEDVVESTHAFYMYDTLDLQVKSQLYGQGFTVTKLLPEVLVDREDIPQKIQDHFYDLVIYGSIHRDSSYLDLVLKSYKKNEIVILDGEDELYIREDLTTRGVYFKRELVDYNKEAPTLPISFAFPKELLIQEVSDKDQLVAKFTSAQNGYLFSTQEEYYQEFKNSYFGLTRKKAGWDCMRHYEIVMNGTLPLFKDLNQLPELTMVHWDRVLLQKCLDLFWEFRVGDGQIENYLALRSEILQHASSNLTTEAMFKYILEKL